MTQARDSLPKSWRLVPLSDAVKFTGGSQPPKDTFINEARDGYVRLIQIRDYKSDRYKTYIPMDLARRSCTKNDVMIGRYGPPVFQILRGIEGSYNVALMKAEPLELMDQEYLFYLLRSPRVQRFVVGNSDRTAGQSGVNLDLLNNYKIPLPPLSEQKRIAGILDKADSIRRKRQQAIGVTEQFRSALFANLFKSAGGSIKAFLQGQVPEGWSDVELAKVADVVDCKHRTPKYADDGPYPVVRPRDVRADGIDLTQCVRTTQDEFLDLTENRKPQVGDIVYSRNASFGEASLVTSTNDFAIGQDVSLIVPSEVNSVFLHRLLNSPAVKHQLGNMVSGSTFKRVNLKSIRKLRIPIPPTQQQEKFAGRIAKNEDQLAQQRTCCDVLDNLFNSLVQRAFRGEL